MPPIGETTSVPGTYLDIVPTAKMPYPAFTTIAEAAYWIGAPITSRWACTLPRSTLAGRG